MTRMKASIGWCCRRVNESVNSFARINRRRHDIRIRKGGTGMSLVELLIGMLLATILLTGLVQIAASARNMFRLHEGIAELQESGRFALDSIGTVLRQAAYTPEPWNEALPPVGLTADTADNVSGRGDRLAIRTWSDRNCLDNPNPVLDAQGLPRFYLRESILELNADANLTHTCRYGPASNQFVNQLQRQGLVQNAEALEIRYAEDTNADGHADRWVAGGQWAEERGVVAIQLGLLLASNDPVTEPASRSFDVLDRLFTAPADGRLRKVWTHTLVLRGRSR